MSKLTTNRELYLAIAELNKEQASSTRTLEEYLRTMLVGARPLAERKTVTLDEFFTMLAESFTQRPTPFDEAWRAQYDTLPASQEDFSGWEATVIRQIVDLREMDEDGTLQNDQRYFGVSSPRKSHWYNFDPCGFVECAAAGSLGGWEPGDDTGRQLVPGEVAVLDDSGNISSVNPEGLPRPVLPIRKLTWEDLKAFMECGQCYE